MEKPRVLSGEALVAKGITKIDASLPEIGLKDVMPNGSWLEQKQIQAALEARKYLIEVERIEKCGTLSHAEWRDDLMLAEVTQKAGSHWQYLGHNVGKTLYLRPEEALFLMEVNCLLLKHNDVTVSLQKAYSLLLGSSTTMIQYKVYASLSRLGYRVLRHTGPKMNDEKITNSRTVNIVESNINPLTAPMNDDSKQSGSPTADLKNSENDDSPMSTGNITEKVDSPTISTVESENDTPIVSLLNNSENGSQIVDKLNESEKEDVLVVNSTVDSEKAESDVPVSNRVSDINSDNSPIVDTVPGSEITDTLKDDTVEMDNTVSDSKSHNSLVDDIAPDSVMVDIAINETVEKSENCSSPMTNKVTENEQNTDHKEGSGSETNRDIVETCEVTCGDKIAENNELNAENNITNDNESSNVMDVDEITALKTSDIKVESETSQEVSSTMTEINKSTENAPETMEICTENLETAMDIILVEESDHSSNSIEGIPAEEPNSMSTSDLEKVVDMKKPADDAVSANNLEDEGNNTVTLTSEDRTTYLENEAKNNDPRNSNICNSTENITQRVYFSKHNEPYSYLNKIEKLTKRQLKPSNLKAMDEFFENLPDFSKVRVATVNIPEQKFIPKNIFVNKTAYTLNLQNIKMRSNRSLSSETPTYTSSDEVSGNNIRRIRSSLEVPSSEYPQNPNVIPHVRFPNFTRFHNFRPYGYWRPQNNLNFYQLMFFQTRFQYHQRPHLMARPPCFNINTNNLNMHNNFRKRIRSGKLDHFQGIRNLAIRLKQSLMSGNTNMANLEALHRSIHSYNLRYKTRLRLNETFDVINDEKIVETIDLDEDEESDSKKPRLEKDDDDKFDENLSRLRQLALRLRDLEAKEEATTSHRRAFSRAIKTFNKSYNADIYLNDANYEVIDRRFITLDSSSESDCVVEEQPKLRPKKLKNPFNILKRRKERLQSLNKPGTSKDTSSGPSQSDASPAELNEDNSNYSELMLKTFNKTWLPNEDDFGRAEVVPKKLMKSRLEISKEQFLYDYKNDQVQNWLETKISFLRYLQETNIAYKTEQARIQADVDMCNTGLKPLIDFEDSSDMPSVLEKLRIIENNKETQVETSLRIDFDVYNRNVQNFRKKNPPTPHFRIICLDESAVIPSAAQIMSLHSKYEDKVPIVFAIVSIGSISYLQMNPIDLPIYVPTTTDVV